MSNDTKLQQLDRVAQELTGGRLRVRKVMVNGNGHYAVDWHMQWCDNSTYWFMNAWHETLDKCLAVELEEIEERTKMDIYGTELFPYIAGEMLAGKGKVTLTIKDVVEEDLANNRTSQRKPVVMFRERNKGFILNKTNAKIIAKLYGRETDDWRGKRISIYAEQGEWFGQPGYAIRVVPEQPPANGNGNGKPPQTIEDVPFEPEPPWDDDLAGSQNGEEDEQEPPTYANGTEIKGDDELEAFNIYLMDEGKAPASRAALQRYSRKAQAGEDGE